MCVCVGGGGISYRNMILWLQKQTMEQAVLAGTGGCPPIETMKLHSQVYDVSVSGFSGGLATAAALP